MRLIDADNLKAELKKLPMMSNWGETFMPSLIDDQPTAYDPDKVVEALEAEKDKHFFGTHDEEREVYCMGIDDAIEIVKKGGVE